MSCDDLRFINHGAYDLVFELAVFLFRCSFLFMKQPVDISCRLLLILPVVQQEVV